MALWAKKMSQASSTKNLVSPKDNPNLKVFRNEALNACPLNFSSGKGNLSSYLAK